MYTLRAVKYLVVDGMYMIIWGSQRCLSTLWTTKICSEMSRAGSACSQRTESIDAARFLFDGCLIGLSVKPKHVDTDYGYQITIVESELGSWAC